MAGFEVSETSIPGLYRVDSKIIEDERGSVMVLHTNSDYEASGLPAIGTRPQTNAPLTRRGAIRGIHAEAAHKHVAVAYGEVYAAIVDLNPESPTFGQWEGFELERGQGLFVSSGLGNSFQGVSETSIYLYDFEAEWYPGMPGRACDPFDPELNIAWPIKDVIISEKDRRNPSLADIRSENA
jgi:dTDP-4-dehydrorhamnose 3,5-epimerase